MERGGRVALPMRVDGPFIDVTINLPHSPLAGIQVTGLIDTGSDFVLISNSIARRLQLRHTNDDVVGGIAGGEVDAKVHSGCIEVPHLSFKKVLPLYAVPWGQGLSP